MLYGTVPTPPSLSAGESVVDTLRRGVVVPYSEFGKTTPNSSSASSIQHPESRFDSDSDPTQTDFWTPFFFSGRLRNTPSRGRVVKISNTPSFYYSCRVRIWIIWWWGDVNLTSATLSAIRGGQAKQYPPLLIGSSYVFLLIKPSVGRDMDNWISWFGYPYVHE